MFFFPRAIFIIIIYKLDHFLFSFPCPSMLAGPLLLSLFIHRKLQGHSYSRDHVYVVPLLPRSQWAKRRRDRLVHYSTS